MKRGDLKGVVVAGVENLELLLLADGEHASFEVGTVLSQCGLA